METTFKKGTSKTVGNHEVILENVPNKYIGMVFDRSYMGGRWRAMKWTKNGNAPKGFSHFDLAL